MKEIMDLMQETQHLMYCFHSLDLVSFNFAILLSFKEAMACVAGGILYAAHVLFWQ